MANFVGTAPPASNSAGRGILRAALVSGVALVLLAGSMGSADAQRGFYGPGWYSYPVGVPARRARPAPPPLSKKEKADPKKDPGFGELPKGPLQVVVSIANQRVTLFSNGVRVAQGPVSTGVPSNPTPMGVFSVIEKDRHHRSNLYSNAPMPFMQRITWSGVALHEGVLPGYPASHGCIRMSHDFAKKLWPVTKLGVRVIVTRNELEPTEFSHPKLFTPKLKPAEPKVAMKAETDGLSPARPIRLAQATAPDTAADPSEAASRLPEDGRAAESTAQPVETVKPIDDAKATETVKPAEEVKAAETTLPGASTTTDEMKATGALQPSGPTEAPPTLSPDDLRKSVEAPQPIAPAKSADTAPTQPAPTQAAPESDDAVKPAPTVIDPMKPLAPRLKADQPVKRTGQVAVFVSRKEKKVFVRHGMVPLFDMPVVIAEPDRPLGVHVFTAMGVTNNGEGMRWNLFTVPNDTSVSVDSRRRSKREPPPKLTLPQKPIVHLKPSTAAEALDRIELPKEAIDRISELLMPGSSLVIADDGLGRETGRYTDFIVLTR